MYDVAEKPYPKPMLEQVDYQRLAEDFGALAELEHGILEDCREYLEKLEAQLSKANMIQVAELITAHLCFYLGTVIAMYQPDDAKNIAEAVVKLIKIHAKHALAKFNEYPINSTVNTRAEKTEHLQDLRENSPGSIVAQTMRLGKQCFDMMERLQDNHVGLSIRKAPNPADNMCPHDEFLNFVIPLVNQQQVKWQQNLRGQSLNYVINQLAIQIAWLVGYFSHLSKRAADSLLSYGLPCVALNMEYTLKVFSIIRGKSRIGNNLEKMLDKSTETLMSEIQTLSSKTHADIPPAVTDFQKQSRLVQAAVEKQIVDLIMAKMPPKVIVMSLFYFWFTLDAPIQMKNPDAIDNYPIFEQMPAIIEIVKTTARDLPAPELSDEIKLLNQKMQALKSTLPSPESLDEVPQTHIEAQSSQVNTAIHSLTSDFLQQDIHPEIIANVLFSQWLRLNVLYGIREQDWQKMDHYFVEIMQAVRKHLASLG